MNRWDFDCQKCGVNIGDAYYVEPEWWQCYQNKNKTRILMDIHPRYTINEKGEPISGTYPEAKDLEEITEKIKVVIADTTVKSRGTFSQTKTTSYVADFDTHIVIWYRYADENAYKQSVGIKEHTIKGSGRGRVGYCFCNKCAESLDYKCPICNSPLIKIEAEDHPGGGGWGIRSGVNKREPYPMTW